MVAIAATFYLVVVASLNGATYFNYLTNWGNCMVVVNYINLMVSHVLLGHMSCGREPCRVSLWSCYWKLSTLIYELTVVLICEITICYWTIVFPFLLSGPQWQSPDPRVRWN